MIIITPLRYLVFRSRHCLKGHVLINCFYRAGSLETKYIITILCYGFIGLTYNQNTNFVVTL